RPAGAQQQGRAAGEQLFLQSCAFCHGERGQGTHRGPPIADAGAANAHYQLSTGRMPIDEPIQQPSRSAPSFDPEEIAALVDYVDSLGGGPPIPQINPERGDLGKGAEVYLLNCASCHGTTGVGSVLLGHFDAPALFASTPLQIAEAIRVGPTTMPSFGHDVLNDEELDSVVAYVLYLQDPVDAGGLPLGRFGPVAEGAVALTFGVGVLLLITRWLGKQA
ncbi:MAG: c-type cytochrome, partial [Actinomycetota bacterium]|nr:c-type cytochrome [Actinomycetota bacterium]